MNKMHFKKYTTIQAVGACPQLDGLSQNCSHIVVSGGTGGPSKQKVLWHVAMLEISYTN